MKRTIKITLLISILSTTVGCENPIECADCEGFSFTENYLKNIQKNEIFFIKGEALDVNNHGRKIKIIEDLKGNLADKSSIFVWGMSSTSFCDNKGRQDMRIDNVTQYQKNDTLIMLIEKTRKRFPGDIERSSDYATLGGCAYSVLKLSNDTVTGVMYPEGHRQTASWAELQEELHTLLNEK